MASVSPRAELLPEDAYLSSIKDDSDRETEAWESKASSMSQPLTQGRGTVEPNPVEPY
jgi:hypothetical protein